MPSKELKKKIGQLFFFGFDGKNVTSHIRELITRHNVGGLIFFGRNLSEPLQAWELIRSLKAPGLLCGIDHEGGRVIRLPPPVTQFPSAAAIGRRNSPNLAYQAALFQGRELAAVGFNLNFAPVLDIATNPVNQVVGDRAFSSQPEVVARLGAEWIRGLTDAGIVACGKHFPGHGDTREDSHEELPRTKLGAQELLERELIPFQQAMKKGLKALMTAHVLYEGVDATYPATLSSTLLGNLLRKRLGFSGAVITDDLEMKGVADHWDVEDRTLLAIKAGADMLMFCHSVDVQFKALETVYRAVDGRIIRPERIEESFQRVQELKRLCAATRPSSGRGELMAVLNNPEHKRIAASLQ